MFSAASSSVIARKIFLPTASAQIRKSSHAAVRDGVFRPKSTKDIWAGDAGAYPVMVGIAWCLVFAGGFSLYYFVSSPDVRVIGDSRVKLFRGELNEYKRQ